MQSGLGEKCDDGNSANEDGCSNACKLEYCGDNVVQASKEQCDDGNTNNNDGCSSTCQRETSSTSFEHTYEAEEMGKSAGGPVSGGLWNLWTWGYLKQITSHVPKSGTYKVIIVAKGQLAGSEPPMVAVKVDGVLVKTIALSSISLTSYELTVNLNSNSLIEMRYLNDFNVPGIGDRNALFDKLIVKSLQN